MDLAALTAASPSACSGGSLTVVVLLTPRSAAGEIFEEMGAGSFKTGFNGGAGGEGGPKHGGGGGAGGPRHGGGAGAGGP